MLRVGWGTWEKPGDEPLEAKFSTKHLAGYHLKVAQMYSTNNIVCLWFKLFDERFDRTDNEMERSQADRVGGRFPV